MIETVVKSIRFNRITNNRVVLLKETAGDRYLPIWIGEFEAHAIAMELQGVDPLGRCPMTSCAPCWRSLAVRSSTC